ncbi:MAG: hypothetical protein FRX49_07145 [Trebouxia sp. A1-2]|nr:MAG: hypothetical protein FRX49_07145 [Trebouxia sp. A1-2]
MSAAAASDGAMPLGQYRQARLALFQAMQVTRVDKRNKQHLFEHVQLGKHQDIKQSLIRIRAWAHTEGCKHRPQPQPGRAKQSRNTEGRPVMPDGMWEDMLLRLPSMLPLILSAAPQLATDLHAQPPVRAPPLKLQSISQSRRHDTSPSPLIARQMLHLVRHLGVAALDRCFGDRGQGASERFIDTAGKQATTRMRGAACYSRPNQNAQQWAAPCDNLLILGVARGGDDGFSIGGGPAFSTAAELLSCLDTCTLACFGFRASQPKVYHWAGATLCSKPAAIALTLIPICDPIDSSGVKVLLP